MSEDIEDVSFLPGDSLNRRSVYEPSIRQRCKQLVCSQGRATAIIVIVGLFILIIALVASLARPGGSNTQCNVDTHLKDNTPSKTEQTTPSYIATNNQTFPWHNVRLPRTVLPISYDIQLHADLKGKVFNGHVEISCKVFDKTNSVVLHSKDLNLKSIKIQSPKQVNVVSHLEYVANEQVYIALDREVTVGETFKLIFDIDGRLDKKLMGFYLSSYKDKNGLSKYLATTQFESTAARQAFPCFDEPDMKATFTMSIIHDPEYYSLFNTPLNSSANYKDGLVIDKFQPTVKMSTYLVAFIVCDFKSISNTTKHGTKVTVHAPEDQIYQASYALEVAVSCLEYFDEMFGVPYPLPKQDLVAIPDFSAGAMENWGLITFRMVSVLYDPKRSSYSSKEWVALSVTHELAHQWFGNLVTLKWWDDLWLNEGFASFVEYLGTGRAEPTWQMPEQFVSVDLQRALARDSLKSSHPIQIHVDSPDQINEIFDDISYHKGASLIRMLKSCLGEKVFNDGITAYLNKYKYGNAITEDLWNVLSETAGNNMNIKEVMDTWTKQMGYPVITVSSKGSQVSLSQKRFLLFPNSTLKEGFKSPYEYKWQVPFTYMVMNKNGTMTKSKDIVWIKDVQGPTLTVPADAKFIKGNVGLFGFYRVNYDVDTWEAIINQLNQNHLRHMAMPPYTVLEEMMDLWEVEVFSQSDRAGLLSDAFAFSRAGLIPITIPLDMTKYLTKETDYLPWDAAMYGLSYIKHRLLYDPIFPTFKKYVLHLMDNLIHNRMKWTDDNNDITQMQKMLRTLLLNEAVYLNDEHCVNKGRELFQNWKTNTSNINPDLRSVIQTVGIRYGTEEDWMFVWDQYNKDTVPTEKIQLLTALSTSQNIILLHRLLEDGTEGKAIKHQDLSRLISNVGSNVYGQLLAWRFVRRNWDNLLKWFGGTAFSMSELILGTTSEFSYKFDLEEVQDFFKDKDAGPGQTAIQTTVEKIQMNVQWMEANQKTVTKWMTDNVD